MQVEAFLLRPSNGVPNHPRWPLLLYPAAVQICAPDPAAAFENLFNGNHWPAAWRNGVYGLQHFHSTAHEALGVYNGEVTVQFGGDDGIKLTARAGDVIVLPAGTGHMKLASRGALGIVGAYPEGQQPDHCTPDRSALDRCVTMIAAVATPRFDPVYGLKGPLLQHWR